MRETRLNKLLFVGAVVGGAGLWTVFAAFKTEPWDSPYGWGAITALGLVLGFLGKGNPVVWPLGIFLGEVLFGVGRLAMNAYFYSGGGVDFLFPLGLLFLVAFTVPALVGSFVGCGIRKATQTLLRPAVTPRNRGS